MTSQAIEKHKKLLKSRPDISFWGDNIFDASTDLNDPNDWKYFYSYLTQSPTFFDIDKPKPGKTVGELNLKEAPKIPPYAANQRLEIHNNGNEQFILVKTIES